MKKLLGISLVAVLAVSPLMAGAETVAASTTIGEDSTEAGLTKTGTNVVVAGKGKYYAGKSITDNDRGATASAAYVKGAYNDAISAINAVAETADGAVQEVVEGSTGGAISVDGTAVSVHTDSDHRFVSDTEKSTWSGKQDALNETQMNAVNSGIDATKRAAYDALVNASGNYATKEGVSASIDKATATGSINASMTGGTVSGTLTSDTSALVIGGGTITNTVTPTSGTVTIPNAWSGSVNMMTDWGDTQAESLGVSVQSTGNSSASVLTGVSVESSLAGATVTSGAISHTLTGLEVSGTATQSNVSFDVHSTGYYDNASDTTAEYVPSND